MNKLIILIVSFCTLAVFSSELAAQSRNDLDKKYAIYKKNKVKTETIEYSDGSKTISQFDKKGRPTEVKNYNNGVESYITTYNYDKKGYLSEEAYFGYESGDGVTTQFFYDANGQMIKSIASGSMEDITEYVNDEFGNAVTIKYVSTYDKTSAGQIEYKNTYANGLLSTIEAICKEGDDITMFSRYTYDGENLIMNEEFDKDCKTGELKFSFKKIFEYSEDGLITKTAFTSTYTDGVKTGIYKYEK